MLTWNQATELAKICREQGGRIITTNGCFDLLHRGHVEYLNFARQQGDLLLVAINSDESVQKIKGPTRPITSELDRAFVLSALKSVDGVCIFSETTPIEWLKTIRPDIHVKGADWDLDKIPEKKILEEWGAKLIAAPFIKGYSTTEVIQKSRS